MDQPTTSPQSPQSTPSGQSFGALLPAAIAMFAAMMALYGGMAYGLAHGFFQLHSTLLGGSCMGGLFFILLIMIRATRGFFNKFAGRINFAVFMISILGAYFIFLFQTGKYPMGIDLAGGTELTYRLDYARAEENIQNTNNLYKAEQAKDPNSKETQDLSRQLEALKVAMSTASDKAAEIVRKRIDPTGTKGIPVTTLGSNHDRLRIQLPKATPEEVALIKKAVQTRGHLAFHMATDDQTVIQQVEHAKPGQPGSDILQLWEEKDIVTPGRIVKTAAKHDKVVVHRVADMDGSHIVRASARPSTEGSGGWEINVTFDSAGGVEFAQLTDKYVKHRMAIVLDDKAYSAPTIQETIHSECRISGSFDEKEANDLASVLTAGSLPADIVMDNEIQVGPSLGQEQISSGMLAMVIGTGVVIFFMMVYYRLSGLIASFCMLLNLPMLLGAMGFFKATLTLPGIAGIVLTLGMAVDANVLIIERLREELARGRNLRQAVAYGFDRAFLTIIDCHSTTLISSIILYYLGTGPVRGFAVSLSVGILTTLFCNLWLNWLIMDWLVSRDALPTLKMMQFFKHSNIDFMGQRRMWMTITGAAAVISLVLFAVDQKDLYDVDFTGGTRLQFNFARGKAEDQEQVRKTIEEKVAGQLKTLAATEVSKAEKDKTKPPEWAADLNKSAAGLEVQSIDVPEEGTKTKFRKFTVTSGVTDPEAVNLLKTQLLTTFKEGLEPDAISTTDKGILVRLNEAQTQSSIDVARQRVAEALTALTQDATMQDPSNAAVKSALQAMKVTDAKNENGYIAVEVAPVPADPALKDKVVAAVAGAKIAGRADGAISRTESFGAQVASGMWKQALTALVLANLAVFIYIWFRFEFSGAWGFGAIVALIHDTVIATGGVVALHMLAPITGYPLRIDLNIVAALLTITGFSVNDTIVVFDRIREVKHAHPTRSYEEIVNEAVNATLSRTILTSLTVLLADASLLIFGGPTIRGMAYTLMVGFTVGTYSSIFIAAPLMIWWWRKFGAGAGAAAPAGERPSKPAATAPQV